MWNLPIPDTQTLDWYENELLDKLVKRVSADKGNCHKIIKSMLMPNGSKDILKRLLTEQPAVALALNSQLMSALL